MSKFISKLLIVVILSLLIINGVVVNGKPTSAEKMYCKANINDDFSGNYIYIILTKEESANLTDYLLEEYLVEEFNIRINGFVELTKEKTDYYRQYKQELNSANNFRRIFRIELEEYSKENVLNVIRKLESVDKFKYVGVEYNYDLISCSSSENIVVHENQIENYELVSLTEAWEVSTGSSDILVGVLDTGIQGTHPDLVENLNVQLSRDFTTTDQYGNVIALPVNVATDSNGHGTHVAGIIGANGLVKGIAPNITLVSLKIFGNENNFNKELLIPRLSQAFNYAESNNIKIINFSGGVYGDISCEEDPVVEEIINGYDGLFVVAAGNYPCDLDAYVNGDRVDIFCPQIHESENMIVVGGLNTGGDFSISNPDRVYNSCYGIESVDLFAPGTNVYSTHIDDNGYKSLSGTSMSTAFVTGTCALLMSLYPDIRLDEIKYIIMKSVDKMQSIIDKCVSGGKLNVYKAVTLDIYEGNGTLGNPYRINSIMEFNLIRYKNTNNTFFKLYEDLNFNNSNHMLHNFVFEGVFDGNNHSISNINNNVRYPITYQYIGGIFGRNNGTIKNVEINNLNLNVSIDDSVLKFVGGVVGQNENIIENIKIYDSTISTDSIYVNSGGISSENVCINQTSGIKNCVVTRTNITGRGYVGGITANNEFGTINMCSLIQSNVNYSQVGMNNKGAGGIIGFNKSVVSNSGIDSNSKVKYTGNSTTLFIKPRMGKIVGLNWSGEQGVQNCANTGLLDIGNLNVQFQQLDFVGTYYDGKVGKEEG